MVTLWDRAIDLILLGDTNTALSRCNNSLNSVILPFQWRWPSSYQQPAHRHARLLLEAMGIHLHVRGLPNLVVVLSLHRSICQVTRLFRVLTLLYDVTECSF